MILKRTDKYLVFSLILGLFLSCAERNIGGNISIEILQNEFINDNISELEYLSGQYNYIEEAIVELEKGLFSMEHEKIRVTNGCINLVRTDEAAIAIAKIVLPSYTQKAIGNKFTTIASKFKNLWIVGLLQSKTFVQADFDTTFAVIVISKHTAEILMISLVR
jgi:hypothetical protein